MKDLILRYRSVVKFILVFLLVYGLLTISYKFYLDWSTGTKHYPDYITNLVAKQSKTLLSSIGYETTMQSHPNEPSIKLLVRDKYVARVVEGCNSISVIILFVAFIIAFSGTPKRTFFFIIAGSILIYAFNLIRIAILSIGLFHYPWRRTTLHTVIFPLMIYGLVFLLWMVWVQRFKRMNNDHVLES